MARVIGTGIEARCKVSRGGGETVCGGGHRSRGGVPGDHPPRRRDAMTRDGVRTRRRHRRARRREHLAEDGRERSARVDTRERSVATDARRDLRQTVT